MSEARDKVIELKRNLYRFIPTEHDCRYVDALSRRFGNSDSPELLDSDVEILRRIYSHTTQLKERRAIAYTVQGVEYSPPELRALLVDIDSKSKPSAIERRLIVEVQRCIANNQHISGRYILRLDSVIKHLRTKVQAMANGNIYLDDRQRLNVLTASKRVVNFALGRGRKNSFITGNDILAVRQKYVQDGGVDLAALKVEVLHPRVKPADRYKYEYAVDMLEAFLNKIDPEVHEIQGFSARPKL
ncbi:hypothetical protein ACFLZN_02490 [Nanoarchaeota archaeon]